MIISGHHLYARNGAGPCSSVCSGPPGKLQNPGHQTRDQTAVAGDQAQRRGRQRGGGEEQSRREGQSVGDYWAGAVRRPEGPQGQKPGDWLSVSKGRSGRRQVVELSPDKR